MGKLNRLSKATLTILILPLYAFAAEVTPATSEDISDFDRHIEVSHSEAAHEAHRDSAKRVAKEIADFKKDQRMDVEKSENSADARGHGHHRRADSDDVRAGRGRTGDDGSQDAAPRDKLPAPAKKRGWKQ